MFASAVWFERNLRRMGRAGWHDLTRSKDGEHRAGGASSGIEGAVSGAATGSAPASTGARAEPSRAAAVRAVPLAVASCSLCSPIVDGV